MIRKLFETNRSRLLENFKKLKPSAQGVILLKGHRPCNELDSDTTHPHMQFEANFTYVFGVQTHFYDGMLFLDSGRTVLISNFPSHDLASTRLSLEASHEHFSIDEMIDVAQLPSYLSEKKVSTVFVHAGNDMYSRAASHEYDDPILKQIGAEVDRDTLYPILNMTRCIKSEIELEVMRGICEVASEAHVHAMKNIRAGMKEHHIAALFYSYLSARQEGDWAYWPICCSGEDCAILHYFKNDKELYNGRMILSDMGTKRYGICSDITTSYPIGGKFSQKQKEIFELTAAAQANGIAMLKPGVLYGDIQVEGFKIIIKGLLELGLIKGDPQELFEKNVYFTFMPHNIGHYIGFKTHDVGLPVKEADIDALEKQELAAHEKKFDEENKCADNDEKHALAKEKFLGEKRAEIQEKRATRLKGYAPLGKTIVQENMVVTVEPGIYFVDVLINRAKADPEKAKYYNFELIEEYKKEVGGVRIEDCVQVTATGSRVLSKIPKTVAEIEAIMQQ